MCGARGGPEDLNWFVLVVGTNNLIDAMHIKFNCVVLSDLGD